MKKCGFTLAEVLITMGIIGVVAALTAPALVQNAATAKVGPALKKAVSTLENAHKQLLVDEEINYLTTDSISSSYFTNLKKQLRGASVESGSYNGNEFKPYYSGKIQPSQTTIGEVNRACLHLSDGVDVIYVGTSLLRSGDNYADYSAKGSFKGRLVTIIIDINGIKTKPNTFGKDLFAFAIDKSGVLVPAGSSTAEWLGFTEKYDTSTSTSDMKCDSSEVTTGLGCAGAVFDNNLKVTYRQY